ncbi:MAG: phage major tail tube protein [Fibrobacter sp.]|nr:phage major tail tube protein [Fibrobacter sp.]
MSIEINRVTNANVYIDGTSLLGKVDEVTLPEIKPLMSEHKALGMIAKIELPSGIDKLEAKFKFNSFYPSVMMSIANPYSVRKVMVRASAETYTGMGKISEVPVVCHMSGTFKKIPMGGFKQAENVELETEMNCLYAKMMIRGVTIFELDTMANIFKVAGADILAMYRLNIG